MQREGGRRAERGGRLRLRVCDPTQGFRFTDSALENFGKILTKRGHRAIELAVRFDF